MTVPSRVLALIGPLALLVAACGPAAPSGGVAPTAGATGAPAAATAADKPLRGGTLTFSINADITDMDPMRSRLFVDRNLMYQMYDSLVRIDAKGQIIPWLAEKWTVSDDGKTYTFSLRKDVKFHDGSPFDAEAVKFNLDRASKTEGSARRGELTPVDSVSVVDASTVKVALKSPFAPFLSLLVDRAGMMVSRKVVEAAGADFTRKAFKAGTGPFILTEAVKDSHYTFEKNADWWYKAPNGDKLPYLDKVVVKPISDGDVRLTNIRTGQVHATNTITGKDVPVVKADPTLLYKEIGAYSWDSLIPNRTKGFVFEEPRYIKAVSMAIDRQEILEKGPAQGVGVVAWGPIAPSHFAFDAGFKPFAKGDPAGAKKLVTDVGKGPLKFELLVSSGNAATLQLAQLIQSQLAKADITADIKTMLFNDIVTLQGQKKHPGMTLIGWSGRIDPDGNFYDHVRTGGPNNDSAYSNTQVDDLLDQQRAATTEAKRTELLRKAQQIFVVDDPARVWFSFGVAQLLMTREVQGVEPYPDQLPRLHTGWLKK
ncbi:MAG: peptide ABC transporter substrate-binding protein [Chloroflexi bacterium]|nr:peptide ABC transporter substrate-binding protein [Chloroflexota bacterium]